MLFKTGGYVTFKGGFARKASPTRHAGYSIKKPCLGFLANFEKLFFKFNIITAIMKDKNLLQDYYPYLYALNRCKNKAKQQTNKLFKLQFKREIYFLRKYKFKLNLNKYKFEEKFLFRLSNIISKIYSKQIEFNIVNLKNIVFNADLFTEISTLKIKKRNTKAVKIINIMLNKAKLPKLNTIQERGRIVRSLNLNLVENKYGTLNIKDILSSLLNLDKLLNNLYGSLLPTPNTRQRSSGGGLLFRRSWNRVASDLLDKPAAFLSVNEGGVAASDLLEKPPAVGGGFPGLRPPVVNKKFLRPRSSQTGAAAKLYNIVFNSIKYKNMAGIRMVVKGRLTPRYRADRSVYKLR